MASSAEVDAIAAFVAPPSGGSKNGWGLVSADGITSYDTALALGALVSAGRPPSSLALQLGELFTRRNQVSVQGTTHAGWSVDGFAATSVTGVGEPTVTSEILRAIAPMAMTPVIVTLDPTTGRTDVVVEPTSGSPVPLRDSAPVQEALRFISAQGAPVNASVPTLEIAARLAAIRAFGFDETVPGWGQNALEAELLRDERLAGGVWSAQDAFVNAIGLLALTSKPGANFDTGPDWDGDGHANTVDAFPHGASEWLDTDRDGVGNTADADDDGDGHPDASDLFPTDPSEFANLDGDALGDSEDPDDDNDGWTDEQELSAGLDPRSADSDLDGEIDSLDECPLDADPLAADADGDGVCTPHDPCPQAYGASDLDGDGQCDVVDADIDGDNVLNTAELEAGSDPYNSASRPAVLVPTEDLDRDGVPNFLETSSSPYLADTDSDGSLDHEEIFSGTTPSNPASRPAIALGTIAFVGSIDGSGEPRIAAGSWRMSATGGQPTPVAPTSDPIGSGPSASQSFAGFQPMTLAFDVDGDGLAGVHEARLGSSMHDIDSDGDGFVDGYDGVVVKATSGVSNGYDLLGNGTLAGELGNSATPGDDTDPANAASYPGSPGDIAPLGRPDGRVNIADAALALRCVENPSVVTNLNEDARALTLRGGDRDSSGAIGINDFTVIFEMATD